MVVMGLAILFNALGDYGLIFGHFGLPQLGLVGAGFASASSNLFTLVAMTVIALGVPALKRYRFLHRFVRPHWRSLARIVPSGRSHRHHHAVRGRPVQRRHPGDGHVRHRRHWPRTRSPSPFPRSPSWCRWASGWPRPCGWGWRRALATPMARGAPASPPWAWARSFMLCDGAAAAVFPPHHRHAVAARHRRQSRRAGAGGAVPACRRRLPADGRPASHRLDELARTEGCARADVAGGRVLLAGGRADVRAPGLRSWHAGPGHLAGTGLRPSGGGGPAHQPLLLYCQRSPCQRHSSATANTARSAISATRSGRPLRSCSRAISRAVSG